MLCATTCNAPELHQATHEAETRRAGQEVMQLRRELHRFKSGGGGGHYSGPPSFHHPHSAVACGGGGEGNGSGGEERHWSDGDGGASPEPLHGESAAYWLPGLDVSGQADLNASLPANSPSGDMRPSGSTNGPPLQAASREAPLMPAPSTAAVAATGKQAPLRDRRSSLSVSWGNAASALNVANAASTQGQQRQQQHDNEPRALPPRQSVGLTPPRIRRARTAESANKTSQVPQGSSRGSNGKGPGVPKEQGGKAAALAGAHAAALEAYLKTHA